MKRLTRSLFRGGLVFKAHRILFLGVRVIKDKQKKVPLRRGGVVVVAHEALGG